MTAGTPQGRAKHSFPLRTLLIAAIAIPTLLFAAIAWRDHVRLFREADETVDRLTALAHEHALKVIETNSLVLDRIEDRLRGLSWEEIFARQKDLHDALRALEAQIEQITALHVVAPDGRLAAISIAYPAPGHNLADRGYFRRHAAGEAGPVFGDPAVGRTSGRVAFTMSRRRAAADGGFDGVILGSILPAYFQRHWATLAAGRDVHFGLVRPDGLVLARMPPPPGTDVRMPPAGALMRAIAATDRGRVAVSPALDGSERLIGFRRVGQHPLFVFFALSLDAVRAEWHGHLVMNGLLALAAALVLGGATLLAGRRWQAELAAQAELARSAEELRAEIARREAAEAGLHAAQRLEAVGRLTGGVAHDFNNLLTAVLGSVQLLERHLQHLGRAGCPEGGPLDAKARRLLTTARDAVERGTRLTSSLLAFARRQALRAEPLDANALVAGMLPLLRRALGEPAELRLALGRGVPPCLADAAQLEAALLNLIINARDALPASGGSVAIRTFRADPAAEVGAGQVCIAVADNGAGMTEEVRERAFDPFFTTKPVGRGTGLGLSQVYGVVRQLGGEVTIESAPGAGTTVLLRLPEADPAAAAATRPADAAPPAAPAGTAAAGDAAAVETGAGGGGPGRCALVVEDDPAVLDMAAETLQEAGWRVLKAPDGRAALSVLECRSGSERIDLLFSDVVMPGGLSGVALAHAARRLRPEIAVLLASGYAGEALAAEGAGGAADFPLLGKPYDRATLLAAIAALTAPSPAAARPEMAAR